MRKRFWAFPFLGALGIISILSRFGGVPGFSMRLFLYVILVGIFLLGFIIACKVRRDYKRRMMSVSRIRK
jgi:hypothetical protein